MPVQEVKQATSGSPGEIERRPAGVENRSAEIEELGGQIARLDRRARAWSTARLLCFAGLLAGAVLGFEAAAYAIIACPLALAAFAGAVLAHGKVLDRRDALEDRKLLLSEALERQRTRRRRHPAPMIPVNATPLERGLRIFLPEPESLALDAATADDLGLFETAGPGTLGSALDGSSDSSPDSRSGGCGTVPPIGAARTLYGFLDWTSTAFGARRLRHLLLHPLRHATDIRARQEAVAELARKPQARERMLSILLPLRRQNLAPLARFLSDPAPFAKRAGLLILASVLGTAAPLALAVLVFTGNLDYLAALFPLLAANFFLIGLNVKRTNPERDRLLLFGPLIDGILRLETVLQTETIDAVEWIRITKTLKTIHPHAAKLKRYISLLAFHSYGAFFELVNILTLWELRLLPLADAVFARHRRELEEAAGALGEAEALLCLSIPLAEQEGFEMPEIVEVTGSMRPMLRAAEIGHPLLEHAAAVRNPVSLGDGANALIVTGSNMAGKSTYLKSAGLNVVLAGTGGPVCATGFRWTPPMDLHSDINVRDSLDDGKSYFQVEVERVRRVIEAAQQSPFLLAVFDELFRGTNSEERIALARAIIRHLRSTGALIIVATHDLALTRLVTEDRESGMENRHFRETVEDGVMRFDYRLREGPAATRNAIRVLEAQGYPEEITREARERVAQTSAPPVRPEGP